MSNSEECMQYMREYWKPVLTLLSIVCVLGVFTYVFTSPTSRFTDVQNDLKTIKPDEQFAYTTLDGVEIDIRDFKGKPLIINSWATWSPFSQTELILFGRLTEEYAGDVTVVAINRMENPIIIRSFLTTFDIPESVQVLLDPSDHFYKAVNGYAMPETLIYDRDGVLVEHIRGVVTEDVIRRHISNLLTK